MTITLPNTFRNIPIPRRMTTLRRTESGMPIPKFASWINGKPDFTVMDMTFMKSAITARRCGICGEPLGRYASFVGGPLSQLSGQYSEPPFHKDCAEFALQICPFILTGHNMRKNKPTAQIMVNNKVSPENPKVFGLVTATIGTYSFEPRYMTFFLTETAEPEWWYQGHRVTSDEDRAILENALRAAQYNIQEQARAAGITRKIFLNPL